MDLVNDLSTLARIISGGEAPHDHSKILHSSTNILALRPKASPIAYGVVLQRFFRGPYCRHRGTLLSYCLQSYGQYRIAILRAVGTMVIRIILAFQGASTIRAYDCCNAYNRLHRPKNLPSVAEIAPDLAALEQANQRTKVTKTPTTKRREYH